MNVLITAIGSFSADCAIRSLRDYGYKVYGCDIYPAEWHAVSKLCEQVFRAPFATLEDEYIQFLVDTCKEYKITYLLPLTDLEIDVINAHRFVFDENGITLCMQSDECLAIARDKYAMYELFATDEKVDVPYSVHSSKLSDDFKLPAIAKPVNGRSSEGLLHVTEPSELEVLQQKDNYIIQEMIEGSIYTVDYVRDANGNDFAVPREELLRTKNGAGTTVRVVPNEKLQQTVSYIGQKLGIVGCVNMEFIENAGKYFLIDINPRFSAGVAFSNFVGFNMIISHMNAINGLNIDPQIVFDEQIICKHYKEELLLKKNRN